MSERAACAAKKPNFCSHDHSFSSINSPETVLEISAVPEYFGIHFSLVLRKIKKVFFMIVKKDKMFTRKTLFFIFLNKRLQIVPKHSGTAEISKTVSGLSIEEKLWS